METRQIVLRSVSYFYLAFGALLFEFFDFAVKRNFASEKNICVFDQSLFENTDLFWVLARSRVLFSFSLSFVVTSIIIIIYLLAEYPLALL